jgi:hypothetical protein
MPQMLEPMLARLARELPVGEGWAFEHKWDGYLIWTNNPAQSSSAHPTGRGPTGLAMTNQPRRRLPEGPAIADLSSLVPHPAVEAPTGRLIKPLTALIVAESPKDGLTVIVGGKASDRY